MQRRSTSNGRGALAVVMIGAVLLALAVGCSSAGDALSESGGGAVPTPTVESTAGAGGAAVELPRVVQTIDIEGDEYRFELTPDTAEGVRPGWTEIRFHNSGVEAHQVMFARIKDGVDMADLAAAGAGDSSGAGAIEFVDMIGGVSYIDAGNETTALVNLPEGTVLAMCYVPDSHGVAHALMGMSTAVTVTAAAPLPEAPERSAGGPVGEDHVVAGTIELAEEGYRFPDRMETGWYRVRNTDDSLHELSLLRLEHGVDGGDLDSLVDDLAANETPEVELDAMGGMGAISPGFEGYLYLELEPGPYLAVDFMPDPGDPRPHMLDGYSARFDVEADRD